MKKKQLNVFFLPRWFPVKEDPLWGLFVLKHAQAVSLYANVYVIFIDKCHNIDQCYKPFFVDVDGVKTLYYYYHSAGNTKLDKMKSLFKMMRAWYRAWRFATGKWGYPDLNHVHILTRLGVMALLIKLRYKIPYVITEHWSRYLPANLFYKGVVRKVVTKMVVKHAKSIMPVTVNLAEEMKKHGLNNDNYIVIPNCVDTGFFNYKQKRPKNEKFTFIHVSSFDNRAKNISGILKTIARLRTKRDDFIMRIIGDGKDFRDIKKLSDNLNLTDGIVKFEGAAKPEQIAKALKESDMLVIFSNYENMPVVINEALVCGTGVIATDVGGISEVINDSNGYLIPPRDNDALLTVMQQAIDNKNNNDNRKSISERAIELYSMESVGRKINDVYLMVLQRNQNVQ